MQTYTESATLHPHPPYTDDDDDVPGIKKHDVETTFAQNYGLGDIHHVCMKLIIDMYIMEHLFFVSHAREPMAH